MLIVRFASLAVVLLTVTSTLRAHDDVVPYGLNGKIVTGGHDDVLGTDNIEQRVFGYDFGEDIFDPYFIGDPGFNNGGFAAGVYPNDGLLPINSVLGLNILTNLQFWDGVGPVSFGSAPDGVSLGLQRGSNTATVDGAGTITGTIPTIASTGAAGRVHQHANSLLNAADGVNPALPNAPDGIYFLGIDLKLTNGALANSDPIYLVYNNGLSEAVHDAAIDWVQTNVVPEPGTWAMLGLTGLALVGYRLRRPRVARA